MMFLIFDTLTDNSLFNELFLHLTKSILFILNAICLRCSNNYWTRTNPKKYVIIVRTNLVLSFHQSKDLLIIIRSNHFHPRFSLEDIIEMIFQSNLLQSMKTKMKLLCDEKKRRNSTQTNIINQSSSLVSPFIFVDRCKQEQALIFSLSLLLCAIPTE